MPEDQKLRHPNLRWISTGSSFPPSNTPIYHIPTARINYTTDDYGTAIWLTRIDQLISRRLDRKGIIFTVSYQRRDLLLRRSQYSGIMVTHQARDVIEQVQRFKKMPAPAILVSPTVTTGWDFPGDQCSYIVIGKLPYPDTSDPVTAARHQDDKEWSSFMAMGTMIQSAGRGTRCLSWDTQILTKDGWKGPGEITEGTEVYSLLPHNFENNLRRPCGMTLNQVRKVHIWDTDKEMIHLTGKSLDICVTSDHGLVILPYQQYRNVAYRAKQNNQRLKTKVVGILAGLHKYKADALPVRFRVPVSGHVQRENSGSNGSHLPVDQREDWLMLMGLIISDGFVHSTQNRIQICQSSAKPEVCVLIDALLGRLNISANKFIQCKKGSIMTCRDKSYARNGDSIKWDIAGYDAIRIRKLFAGKKQTKLPTVRQFVRRPLVKMEKTIPLWVLQKCRKRELRGLLLGLMAGDGHWDVDHEGCGTYYTSDKELADRVQYLLVLSDYRSRIRHRRGNAYEIQFSDNTFVELTQLNVKKESYQGKTWCVTTDLGSIVTRRNGCTAIVGNSADDKCEVFICDDSIKWFWPANKKFAPQWFRDRYRGTLATVPNPLV